MRGWLRVCRFVLGRALEFSLTARGIFSRVYSGGVLSISGQRSRLGRNLRRLETKYHDESRSGTRILGSWRRSDSGYVRISAYALMKQRRHYITCTQETRCARSMCSRSCLAIPYVVAAPRPLAPEETMRVKCALSVPASSMPSQQIQYWIWKWSNAPSVILTFLTA